MTIILVPFFLLYTFFVSVGKLYIFCFSRFEHDNVHICMCRLYGYPLFFLYDARTLCNHISILNWMFWNTTKWCTVSSKCSCSCASKRQSIHAFGLNVKVPKKRCRKKNHFIFFFFHLFKISLLVTFFFLFFWANIFPFRSFFLHVCPFRSDVGRGDALLPNSNSDLLAVNTHLKFSISLYFSVHFFSSVAAAAAWFYTFLWQRENLSVHYTNVDLKQSRQHSKRTDTALNVEMYEHKKYKWYTRFTFIPYARHYRHATNTALTEWFCARASRTHIIFF